MYKRNKHYLACCNLNIILEMNFYILTFSIILLHAEACPTTPVAGVAWTELGDYCYHISKEAMNWWIAQEYCWGKGGYLAEIMSRDEEDLLDTFLIEGTSYWLGLTDISHEGILYTLEKRFNLTF